MFMIIVDILSRLFTNSEVPLTTISELFGMVIFIVIIYNRRRPILEKY